MTTLKLKLLWEKYRPTDIKMMILLPRIESLLKDTEISSNFIFYGSSGIGKTTFANILAEKYNFLKINASKENGIDILRGKIEKYITTLVLSNKESNIKVIYLDEFDRASSEMQDALKSFIEYYSDRARFIFTTNHINKINKELRSRFEEINFDPINKVEREFMFNKQILYLKAIAKRENFPDWNNTNLLSQIIKKNFPDLRKSIVSLNRLLKSGELNIIESDYCTDKIDFYNFLMDKNITPIYNYDYIIDNYFTSFDDIFEFLGRPFFEYLKENFIEIAMSKGGTILNIQKSYSENYKDVSDPILHIINYVLDIKQILSK